jgi:IS4 transposase
MLELTLLTTYGGWLSVFNLDILHTFFMLMNTEKLHENISISFTGPTDREFSIEEIIDYYSQRWAIEIFMRSPKENFGFDQYQMRKIKGIKRHWYLVFLASSYLVLTRTQEENWPNP